MSVAELIEKIHQLSPEDLDLVRQEMDRIHTADDEWTPEMEAAIEEGLRSAREEPLCTIEDLREDMRKWNTGSK